MLAFVDVDGLKQVNDTRAIWRATRCCSSSVRRFARTSGRYDVIVRYGGDEFVCAMPNVVAPEARARFDKSPR